MPEKKKKIIATGFTMKILCFILLLSLGCAYPKLGTRIIGGQKAKAGQFPFVAGIYVKTLQGQHFCGGTLVSAQYVLTAAYCADGGREFTIRLGTNRLEPPDDLGHLGLTVATGTYVLHPEYDPDTLSHNVALIHLHMNVTYGQYLHPINFIEPENLVPGLVSQVIGWGQISDSVAGEQNDLNYVEVVLISNEECKLTYGDQITETMICSVGNYNEGICVGDTGGPLMYRDQRGSETLIGVAGFFSQQGCETLHPSGYTRIDTYREWILEVTQSG